MTPLSSDLSAVIDSYLGSKGESAPDLTHLLEFREAVRAAIAAGEGGALLMHLKSLTSGTGLHVGRVYLEGLLAAGRNDVATADLSFQPLLEKLNQAQVWPVLGRAALDWIEGAGTHGGVRYLVRAWKQGGVAAVDESMLRIANEVLPTEPDIIWALATTLDEKGSSKESRRLLATALKPLAEHKDAARVEEGILRLIEAPEASILLHALEAVDTLSHKGDGKSAAALLESLRDTSISHGLAGPGWAIARRGMEKHPNETGFRPSAVAFLKAAHPEVPSLDRVIDVTGLDRVAVPAAQALKALDIVLPFSPGYYVEHSGWGLGPIRDNDGEFLTIDFPTKPGHRMKLDSAAKVLTSLPADDLKVLLAIDKPRLLTMRDDDPAALIVIALKRAGGKGSATELRKLLVPGVLATGEWASWWKKIKPRLVEDARIDSRQSFSDNFRLPVPGEETDEPFVLPPFDEPKGINHNVDLIIDFLDHHPAQEEQLKAQTLDRVQRWADRRAAKRHERARAGLLLLKWDPAGRAKHEAALREHFANDFDLSAAGGSDEQLALLDIGISSPETRESALRLGLNARSSIVRDAALKTLLAEPGPGPIKFVADLYQDPVEYTDALFMGADAVASREGKGTADPRLDDLLWPVMLGLIDLLNVTGREPIRKKGLKYLEAGSSLMARVTELPPNERVEAQLTARLRDWRQSDRILFPILDTFSEAGLTTIVESVRQKRKAAHEKLFAGAPAADDVTAGPVIMSRATFDILHAELQQINLDLKTVIPQAIKKARELGDLRENAEYEAAKLKQANASKRLSQLDAQLGKVRILDDMTIDPTKGGPGTEVTVRDTADGTVTTYWVLGEGDGHLGPNVISYLAPLGRALSGRAVGDMVDYQPTDGGGMKKLEITGITIRKP
ncbi:MAG TPA: GreA/GreB family elongation factor [Candidatus Eisenbacteria bacterium]